MVESCDFAGHAFGEDALNEADAVDDVGRDDAQPGQEPGRKAEIH